MLKLPAPPSSGSIAIVLQRSALQKHTCSLLMVVHPSVGRSSLEDVQIWTEHPLYTTGINQKRIQDEEGVTLKLE